MNVAQLLDNSLSNDEWYEVLLTRQRRCCISPPSPWDWKKLTREKKHIWIIILNESSQWGLMPITPEHCIIPLKPRDPPKMYDPRKVYLPFDVDKPQADELQANLNEIMNKLNVDVNECEDD
jgi:hypothetical protein